MSRVKHPNKEIEKALKFAEKNGWKIEKTLKSAHSWGVVRCPTNNQCRNGLYCIRSIWSTPRSPENHARDIIKMVNKCVGDRED